MVKINIVKLIYLIIALTSGTKEMKNVGAKDLGLISKAN